MDEVVLRSLFCNICCFISRNLFFLISIIILKIYIIHFKSFSHFDLICFLQYICWENIFEVSLYLTTIIFDLKHVFLGEMDFETCRIGLFIFPSVLYFCPVGRRESATDRTSYWRLWLSVTFVSDFFLS